MPTSRNSFKGMQEYIKIFAQRFLIQHFNNIKLGIIHCSFIGELNKAHSHNELL